ncbi:MAG: DUF4139 domain-containing protein [Candidatus Cloacimonetes bacterium]|nr:DUF4139 domain-containing protein [Candidatus Cloacimonadota bacterium]
MKWSLTILTLIVLLSINLLVAKDWLTVYNEDLALVRTQMDIPLEKGAQFYNFDQITSRIKTESVVVKSLGESVVVAEQNYEYDLAGTEQILRKYIDKDVSLTSKNLSLYLGKMKFYDGTTIGLIESGTNKLILVNRHEVQQILLAELPSNFYTKPTLRWRLLTGKKGTFPMQISYLTGGLSWSVTYNATWDGSILGLNSWVTLNNQSGRGFENVDLKLIAGEVNQIRPFFNGGGGRYMEDTMYMAKSVAAPSFEEKAFHDFHMYTLSEPVSFADKQIKQLQLFPFKNVKAASVYEYRSHSEGVLSKIKFKNTAENGLGIPLPKGVFKIYKEDTDKNLEFIGEDEINHTSKNEEVYLTTGKAFDLVGKTLVKNTRNLGGNRSESDMQITLRNNSKEDKAIRIVHPRSPNSSINPNSENVKYEITADNLYVWEVTIKPDKEFVLTFTERFSY